MSGDKDNIDNQRYGENHKWVVFYEEENKGMSLQERVRVIS